MAWRFEGRLTIIVHGPRNPSNLEWQSMLRDGIALDRIENGRTVVISYGGGPDGQQRELLTQHMAKRPAPTAILTKSALVRAITAALLFFNRSMKVFGLDEQDRAAEFLGLSPDERDLVGRTRRELETELGLGTTTVLTGHL